jgi:hypothetical protein
MHRLGDFFFFVYDLGLTKAFATSSCHFPETFGKMNNARPRVQDCVFPLVYLYNQPSVVDALPRALDARMREMKILRFQDNGDRVCVRFYLKAGQPQRLDRHRIANDVIATAREWGWISESMVYF